MESLEALHRSQRGKVSDKWSSYLPVYDRLFARYREMPLSLLEIGVQNGGSLEVWSRYFSNARMIVGCDINPRCSELRYADPRIQVVVGDVNADETRLEIAALSENFDLIIDDGSHRSLDVLMAFVNYFPLMNPGGLFFIEDTHALYWEEYQGGILRQTTALAFFKLLADLVNYEHWQNDLGIAQLFSTFFDRAHLPAFLAEGWVEAIEFRNSMVIISKSERPSHAKLGERVISGSEAAVVPQVLELRPAPQSAI